MLPASQGKHIGRDKFATLFGALKTQQYGDPPNRSSLGTTVYVDLQPDFDHS
jgi:hypothetical protein